MKVIQKIVSCIKEQGLKQKFIAEKLGWSEKKLSAVLNCKRVLRADELILFCQVLNKEPNDFIENWNAKERSPA